MTGKPSISVIIPLYNKGPYIARTLQSVLGQTNQDFEIIVVDDGSTDDGPEVVKGYQDPRIRLIQQVNQGVSSARNNGVLAANSDLIAFLDADDEWLPPFIATVLRLRNNYPEAGAYVTSYKFNEQKVGLVGPNLRSIPPAPWEGALPDYFLSTALGDCPISSSTLTMGKEIFWKLGGYPTGIPYGEDAYLWGKLALEYQITFSWEVGAIYHRDAMNRACVKICSLEKEPIVMMINEMLIKGKISNNMEVSLMEYVNKLEFLRARRCIMMGEREEALTILSSNKTMALKKQKAMLTIMAMVPHRLFKNAWKLKRWYSEKVNDIDYSDDPFFKD